MSAIITPALVKRYLIALGRRDVGPFERYMENHPLDDVIRHMDIGLAALGMLAAAEMTHERAAMTRCDRPERSASYELDALERSLVAAAGVDPEAWEKARGA